MLQLGSDIIDFSTVWVFLLLLARFAGVLLSLPGIGTEQLSDDIRLYAALVLALAFTCTGMTAPEAKNTPELVVMFASEFGYGWLLGAIPSFVLAGVGVAGQVISGSIGLGQANMMDKSLGASVSILSKIQISVATLVFLFMDGHQVILRAAGGEPGTIALAVFRPDANMAQILIERLATSFDLAVVVSAPVLVTTLVTQFILGLITKFVPTVNIFIISLPLSILVGLYVVEFTYPGMVQHLLAEFTKTEEILGALSMSGT